MQRKQNRRVSFKQRVTGAAAVAAEPVDTHCAPSTVHTHARQPSRPIESFDALLRLKPPLADSSRGDTAYAMSDYCLHARRLMERVIVLLESIDTGGAPLARLSAAEQQALRALRAQWTEHLRGNFYDLAGPPPASGGATARYSLAVQLWLLVAHANVILQLSDAVGNLFAMYPPASVYLSRNRLVVDNAHVMHYPLRTVLLALEHLVASLDTLDRFTADYSAYVAALEHRVAALVCHTGGRDEYNAPEWCVPADDGGGERVSEEFCIYAMCWLTTAYNYAEGWCACNVVQIYDRVAQRLRVEHVRVPAHEVAIADWAPSARSMRHATTSLCSYAAGLKAGQYAAAMRKFLLQFDLRPGDVDIYRLLHKTNNAHVGSVLQHEFRGASVVARAYLRKLHHDRPVYAYITELLQWQDGEPAHTRSASLSTLGFTRQLVVLGTLDQYITGKFHIPFRERFLIFHRAPDMITALERARTLAYPVIVQQFARFAVFVPHRREPHLDVADVLHWRAETRARRRQLPPPLAAEPAYAGEANVGQHVRVYDCLTALDAFAVWALWLLQLTNGRIDANTDMREFLLDIFGWR